MVRVAALALWACSCATVTPHDLDLRAVNRALPLHHFAQTVEQAQTTLAAQLKWPASPFGTYDVVFEPVPGSDGRVELRVRITNQFADGRPSHLATISLAPDGEGVRAECIFEQPDAGCSDWVWNALGGEGLADVHAAGDAEGEKLSARRRAREQKDEQARLAAYQVERPGSALFVPEWKSSFGFGLAMGGNENGAAAGVILRGGVRRKHSAHFATAYLLEYQFQGQTGTGGGWTSLVVPTFHVEMPFLIDRFPRPPTVYVLASVVGALDIDQAPGSGIGFRGGLGLRADWYFLEAYVQRVWGPSNNQDFNCFGVVGIGF